MPFRLPALLADPAPGEARLWLENARLFDGTGAAPRDSVSVLVEEGRIGRIAHTGEAPPEGALVLDLAGRTLLPGLIDAHAHVGVSFPKPAPAHGAEALLPGTIGHVLAAELREVLRMGITTMRDVGSMGDIVVEARQAMRYGAFRGPRLLTCGRIVSPTGPGGRFFSGMYREADGPDDMRRAAREQLRYGADFVKVMTTGARTVELEDPDPAQLTHDELAVVVEETHRMGYRVCAHCEGLAGTELAIEAGIDTIEHGMYLNQRPDLLERMAASGQVLVPTLSFLLHVAGQDPAADFTASTWTPPLVELGEHNVEQAQLTLVAARNAGVRLAMGHDTAPLHAGANELLRMVEAGLSTCEALVAATSGSACALGLTEHVGTVEPGKLADLLVVDGDPLARPEVLCERARIWLVLRLGTPVAGTALEPTLA
ncbi:MAG: amidohydrolase family protein [Actinomycetota bacterium]|nr:amidohydrolase family protein [Actinomycetota bacterium]